MHFITQNSTYILWEKELYIIYDDAAKNVLAFDNSAALSIKQDIKSVALKPLPL